MRGKEAGREREGHESELWGVVIITQKKRRRVGLVDGLS